MFTGIISDVGEVLEMNARRAKRLDVASAL